MHMLNLFFRSELSMNNGNEWCGKECDSNNNNNYNMNNGNVHTSLVSIQNEDRRVFSAIKRLELEAVHSPLSSANIKHA
jgi:hypothetical protein